MEKFEEYYAPQKNITWERHRFNTRNQKPNKTIDQYVIYLRNKAKSCEFRTLQDGFIRDRIVCGVNNNNQIRRCLLREDLSLKKAIDICRSSEVTAHQMKSFSTVETEKDLHAFSSVFLLAAEALQRAHLQLPGNDVQFSRAEVGQLVFLLGPLAWLVYDQFARVALKAMRDGGSVIQQYIKAHFGGSPADNRYITDDAFNPLKPLVMCQDFSHNFTKSGDQAQFHTRKLQPNGKFIIWKNWIMAALLDWKANSKLTHHQLTKSHLFPNSSCKMRNHLAEEILNSEASNLMQCFWSSLPDGRFLDSNCCTTGYKQDD
ncbi:hypothetical protein HOLleu_33717 [Holothuria leucospilota]|uniref:Uncharacterized protein n=1 Tax=Holothuria leucospilota TaxID=206669 RepID=A0A9Q1BI61_HOLLE|nr:hypothetical protein HOLleu_33717 [Holothuria leucospilota]